LQEHQRLPAMLAVSYYFNEGDFFFGKSGGDDTTAVGAVCRYAFHPRRYSGSLRCCVSAGLRRRCASRQPVSDGAFVLPHGPGWSRLRWVAQYTAPTFSPAPRLLAQVSKAVRSASPSRISGLRVSWPAKGDNQRERCGERKHGTPRYHSG
jgi:hypothetical protein